MGGDVAEVEEGDFKDVTVDFWEEADEEVKASFPGFSVLEPCKLGKIFRRQQRDEGERILTLRMTK